MTPSPVSREIDDIADGIQSLEKRHPRHAKRLRALSAQLDVVSNQLDSEEKDDPTKKESKKKSSSRRQAAAPDIEDGMWEPEDVYQDSYEADDYHKAPVGNDSLSKAIESNLPDKVSELTFAQNTSGKDKHRILVQAGKNGQNGQSRQASWPFGDITPNDVREWAREGDWESVRRASSMALSSGNVRSKNTRVAAEEGWPEMEVDLGRFGAEDNLSTGDLAESGNEDVTKPNDADDEGGVLQFFGTYPQKSSDDGPDSGHHRKNVPAPNRERSSARTLLERVADRPVKPEVKQPDELLNDEPGDNVERDNPLGGLSGQYKGRSSGRQAAPQEYKVYRPQHVPKELHGIWHRAAQKVASQGRLVLSSGNIDYYGIDDVYREGLNFFRRQASKKIVKGREASRTRYASTPGRVKIVRPDFVPRELVAYWNGAAQYLGRRNQLVMTPLKGRTAGRIDYDAVNRQYIRSLDHVMSIQAD
jgi:hypothetical protein